MAAKEMRHVGSEARASVCFRRTLHGDGCEPHSAAVLSRFLTPAEFGISVLGASILGVAEAVRELGSVAYVVQQKDLTQAKIRTVFTISLIVTLSMTIVIVLLSEPIARFYQIPGLARYIEIIAISYAVAPFAHPIYAVLSRDMEVGKLAMLDTLTMLMNALASVILVLQGAGYLVLAWATVISGATWTLLGLYLKRDFSVYRPSLAEWRSVLSFRRIWQRDRRSLPIVCIAIRPHPRQVS